MQFPLKILHLLRLSQASLSLSQKQSRENLLQNHRERQQSLKIERLLPPAAMMKQILPTGMMKKQSRKPRIQEKARQKPVRMRRKPKRGRNNPNRKPQGRRVTSKSSTIPLTHARERGPIHDQGKAQSVPLALTSDQTRT